MFNEKTMGALANFIIKRLRSRKDNRAMIRWQGILEQKNAISIEKADIKPYERTDEVAVNW